MSKKLLYITLLLTMTLSGCAFQRNAEPQKIALSENSSPEKTEPSAVSENPISPASPQVTPALQISFDGCGQKSKYVKAPWYPEFLTAVKKLTHANPFDEPVLGAHMVPERSTALIPEDNIGEMCFSKSGEVVLAIIMGDYGGGAFKLLRYDIATKKLQIAKREDGEGGKDTPWYKSQLKAYSDQAPQDRYLWFVPPDSFGKRAGNLVFLSGSGGDAGCSENADYAYDLTQNYIFIIRGCGQCQDEAERCTDYRDQTGAPL